MLIKRKDGESVGSLLYRFTKGVQRSGVLREAKKRKHHGRAVSRIKRKLSALHRETKKTERERMKKMGMI